LTEFSKVDEFNRFPRLGAGFTAAGLWQQQGDQDQRQTDIPAPMKKGVERISQLEGP